MSLHLLLPTSSISNCHLMTLTHSSSSPAKLNNKQFTPRVPVLLSCIHLGEMHAIRNGLWSRHDVIPSPADRSWLGFWGFGRSEVGSPLPEQGSGGSGLGRGRGWCRVRADGPCRRQQGQMWSWCSPSC